MGLLQLNVGLTETHLSWLAAVEELRGLEVTTLMKHDIYSIQGYLASLSRLYNPSFPIEAHKSPEAMQLKRAVEK
jgi:hypothetical protein